MRSRSAPAKNPSKNNSPITHRAAAGSDERAQAPSFAPRALWRASRRQKQTPQGKCRTGRTSRTIDFAEPQTPGCGLSPLFVPMVLIVPQVPLAVFSVGRLPARQRFSPAATFSHPRDDRAAEGGAADFRRSGGEAGEVVGHDLVGDRAFDAADHEVGSLFPPEVPQHHFSRKQQ